MSLRSLATLAAVLVVVVVTGPATGVTAASDVERSRSGTIGAGQLDAPDQTIRIRLAVDGDSRWRVTARFELNSSEEVAAFERLAARFENGTAEQLALSTFREAATRARANTGRDMQFRRVNRTHAVQNGTGVLVLSFTWTEFARTDGDGDVIAVGDAFNTTNGTWLPYLTAEQTLAIVPPDGYNVQSSPPVSVSNGVARWEGPVDFSGRLPWIVYAGSTETTTTTTTTVTPTPTPTTRTTTVPSPTTVTPTSPSPGGPTTSPGPDGMSSSVLFVVIALVGGLVLIGAYVYRRGPDGLPGTVGESGGDDGATGAASSSTGTEAASESTADATDAADEPATTDAPSVGGAESGAADGTGGPAGGGATADGVADDGTSAGPGDGAVADTGEPATAGTGAADTTADDEGGSDDGIDPELLSDEERVERLIEQNGGRMKQANIVKETGWSNAKVSQLLSSMDEDDRIDKLRIGRENLILFPDEEVTDFDSE